MKVEFHPWYQPGQQLVRCSGDDGCGCLLAEGDVQLHMKWHEKVDRMTSPWKRRGSSPELTGEVCTDPECTIPRKPGGSDPCC
jgi:hypothetical protein